MWKPDKCWYCGGTTFVPDERGYRCTKCGAANDKPLVLGPSPLGRETVTTSWDGRRIIRSRHSRQRGTSARMRQIRLPGTAPETPAE